MSVDPKRAMQEWGRDRIQALFPPCDHFGAIEDLRSVVAFFKYGGSTLFGRMAKPKAFEDPEALVAQAQAGLVAWFEHYGKTGQAERQAELYRLMPPGVPEPALVREQRERAEAKEAAKRAALGSIIRPMAAIAQVSAELAGALREVAHGRGDDFFSTHGALLKPKGKSRHCRNFEWDAPDREWEDLLGSAFEPVFFPFAGADGDSVGVIVSAEKPLVMHYSHEVGMSFMAESLAHWQAMCDEAKSGDKARVDKARGKLLKLTPALIEKTSESAYARAFEAARAAITSLTESTSIAR